MAIPGKLEGAFGADRTADPLSMTFTDLTADTADNEVTITRGTRGGASEAGAGSMSVRMLNANGQYTPRKSGTTPSYHPNMKRGLILRHSVNTGARYLALTGAASGKASTTDKASLDIVGDIAGAVQFRSPVRTPSDALIGYEVVAKWGAAGNRSWRLLLSSNGAPIWYWSTDGTAISALFARLSIPRPDAGPLTLGWEHVVSSGGNNILTWYCCRGTIATLIANKTAYLMGDPVTTVGTTSIFSGTGLVEIGDLANSTFAAYPGGIDAFFLRSGSLDSGTIAANPDFTTQTVATGSFADTAPAPNTWTITAPATISDQKVTFLGTLDSNEGDYPAQSVTGTAQREWTINGPLRRMRQGEKPLQSALFRRIMAPITDTTVRVYYPCEEPSGAEVVSSPIAGIPPGIMGMSLGSDDSLASSKPLPSQSGGQPYGWSLSFPPVTTQTAWEASWMVNLAVQPTGGELLDCRIDTINGTTTQWVFRFDATDFRLFAKNNADPPVNVVATTGGTDPRMYGQWAEILVSLAQNGADIDYAARIIPLDGGSVFNSSGTLAGHTLGIPVGFRTLATAAPGEGFSIGHFTITEGATAGWLARASAAYLGEPAPQRVFRLCREEGVPVVVDGPYFGADGSGWDEAFNAGARPMGPQRAVPLLTLLEECRQVDHGYLGETRELLGLAYRSGITLTNQPARLALTSEVTAPLKPVDDDRGIVNDATVSKDNGSDARYVDTTSVTNDGLYEDSKTINPASDLDLPDHASWWVHEALVEEERYDEIPIELAKNTTKIDDWLSTSHGDRVTASALPAAEAKPVLSQLVTGSTQTISPHLWTAKAATVASMPWDVGVRDSATLGKRDTSGSTTGGTLTTTATSVTVATTLGPVWSTAAGDVPFDIDIDGEQITVTAISSATSPQTFTLTRSVNGVVKTHASGAVVKLWRPTVRAH